MPILCLHNPYLYSILGIEAVRRKILDSRSPSLTLNPYIHRLGPPQSAMCPNMEEEEKIRARRQTALFSKKEFAAISRDPDYNDHLKETNFYFDA